jgi:ferredoxin-NADP reductase
MTLPHPTFPARLLSSRDEAPGVRTFRFTPPPDFRFVPGQFLMFHFSDDPKTWRAYSICSSLADAVDFFEVTVAMVGDFSLRLGALAPGAEQGLVVRGPFGKWIYDGSHPHAVLIAGGSGLTPMRAMCALKRDAKTSGRITLFYSAKTASDFLFRGEFSSWSEAGVTMHLRATRDHGRWTGEQLARLTADDGAVYYICGPNKMVSDLREQLQCSGVSPALIRTEKWGDYTDLF